jgi:serine/threonine protein kinase/Flp pilus assembly protein TadD
MPSITACPSLDLLRRSLDPDDPMPEAQRQDIEEHVNRCDQGCKQAVEALLRGNTLLLASGGTPPGNRPDSLVRAALEEPLPPFLGHYQIVARLCSGDMGVVWRGHDPYLGRDVAIKVPSFRGSEETDARQRFLREVRTAAAVRHAHVCPIYDVGEEQGRPYVVMALVEGETLAERLRRQGRFEDPRAAVQLLLDVADALACVHAAHIVHPDLKPGNILIDRAGEPFLADFGLARIDDGTLLTSAGQIIGTPAYLAPEQAAPELGPVGPLADQFSLAVVLHQMLTGRRPFEGSISALIFQIGSRAVPPPSQHCPGLDSVLEQVLLKALARAPQKRYGSVQDLAQALRSWHDRLPPSADSRDSTRVEAPTTSGATLLAGRDNEAHALYLKARHYWNKRTEDGLRKSITFSNQALDREPSFALAWAGLANAYHQLGHWGLAPPGTAYPRGKSAALKAIALDESLTEAHLALAVILKDYDWNFAGAERAFRRALQQKPDHASGHQWYGQCLACMGRHGEAIAELRRAREFDPLALIHDAVLGRHGYFFARLYEQAREQLNQTIQTDPSFWIAQNFLGWVCLFQGDVAAALAAFAKAQALDDNPENLVGLGYGHALAGQPARARESLDALTALAPERYLAPINLALVYTGLSDRDQAFNWLTKACDDHSQWLSEICVDPAFDPLRSDPRFDALIQRMNITL